MRSRIRTDSISFADGYLVLIVTLLDFEDMELMAPSSESSTTAVFLTKDGCLELRVEGS